MDAVARQEVPDADYVHVTEVPIPAARERAVPDDPAELARRIFDVTAASRPVRLLFGLRQRLVGLIGVAPAPREVFAVREVRDGEAVIAVRDRHLDFCASVGRCADSVRVVTAVRLKGWRGHLYFAPVRVLHPVIVRAMVRSAIVRS